MSGGYRGSEGVFNVLGSDGYMYQKIYMGCIFDPKTNTYSDENYVYNLDNEGCLDFQNPNPKEVA